MYTLELTFAVTKIRFIGWNIAVRLEPVQILLGCVAVERGLAVAVIVAMAMMVMVVRRFLAVFAGYCCQGDGANGAMEGRRANREREHTMLNSGGPINHPSTNDTERSECSAPLLSPCSRDGNA